MVSHHLKRAVFAILIVTTAAPAFAFSGSDPRVNYPFEGGRECYGYSAVNESNEDIDTYGRNRLKELGRKDKLRVRTIWTNPLVIAKHLEARKRIIRACERREQGTGYSRSCPFTDINLEETLDIIDGSRTDAYWMMDADLVRKIGEPLEEEYEALRENLIVACGK